MRLSFVGSVMIILALAGLAPSSAVAQNDTNGRYLYSKCICRFGYVFVFLQSLAPTRAAGA
jgi:hypothetical protein